MEESARAAEEVEKPEEKTHPSFNTELSCGFSEDTTPHFVIPKLADLEDSVYCSYSIAGYDLQKKVFMPEDDRLHELIKKTDIVSGVYEGGGKVNVDKILRSYLVMGGSH